MGKGVKARKKGKINKLKTPINNDIKSQRLAILAWLKSKSLTTLEARTQLDIFHPAARIQELRKRGHHIFTHWETVYTGNKKHRIAKYVLFSEGTSYD